MTPMLMINTTATAKVLWPGVGDPTGGGHSHHYMQHRLAISTNDMARDQEPSPPDTAEPAIERLEPRRIASCLPLYQRLFTVREWRTGLTLFGPPAVHAHYRRGTSELPRTTRRSVSLPRMSGLPHNQPRSAEWLSNFR